MNRLAVLRRWRIARRAASDTAVVPLVVRAHTRDGADVRLLMDVTIRSEAPAEATPARLGQRAVVPAAARWVRGRALTELKNETTALRTAAHDALVAAGGQLARLDLVAVEHLIVSPSGDDVRPERDD